MPPTSPQTTVPNDRVAALEARIAALETQVAILTERDKSAREAELALAERGC